MASLAGGLLKRSEQGLHTALQAMGEEAIYNAVKAVVLANHFANTRREESPDTAVVHRLGFRPNFTGDDKNMSMTLHVVRLGAEPVPAVNPERDQKRVLRVGSRMALSELKKAIFAFWLESCSGKSGNPRIAVMGARLVSKAIKGMAAAGVDVNKGRSMSNFICCPTMENEDDPNKPGERMSVVYLELEGIPRRE